MTYAEKLRDPRWQKKRLEVMNRDGFKCKSCGDATSTLNVHHKYYEKGAMPWDYPETALVTLCEKCHGRTEKKISYINKAIHGAEHRQSRFMWLVGADLGDGPFSHPCFAWTVENLAEFLQSFDRAIADDCADERRVEENLLELKSLSYEVIQGVCSAIEEARQIASSKLRAARDFDCIEVEEPVNALSKPCADELFWGSFLAKANERRPLILHWLMTGVLLSVGEKTIKLGFPKEEESAIVALMRDDAKRFLEELAESLLGRKVAFEMVIDPTLAPSVAYHELA